MIKEAGSRLKVVDGYADVEPISVTLEAVLTAEQTAAAEAADADRARVLVAPPGSGKTVVGCALIADHATPTLVIVDRKPLVEQWRNQLANHLGLTANRSARSAAAVTAPATSWTSR